VCCSHDDIHTSILLPQTMCCRVLQCVAVCGSVLCVAMQVLQHVACFVAVGRSVVQWAVAWCNVMQWATAWRNVIQCVAIGCAQMWR